LDSNGCVLSATGLETLVAREKGLAEYLVPAASGAARNNAVAQDRLNARVHGGVDSHKWHVVFGDTSTHCLVINILEGVSLFAADPKDRLVIFGRPYLESTSSCRGNHVTNVPVIERSRSLVTLLGVDSEVEKLALLEELWEVTPSIWAHGKMW
jgi:hypothetical protein